MMVYLMAYGGYGPTALRMGSNNLSCYVRAAVLKEAERVRVDQCKPPKEQSS